MRKAHRDLLLMVLPVLILATIGLMLRRREAVVPVPPTPFRLTLDAIRFEPMTPREAVGGSTTSASYDTKVSVVLGHRGTLPPWWGKQNGARGATSGSWQLVEHRGKTLRVAQTTKDRPVPMLRWGAAYDPATQKYVAHYLMNLHGVSRSGELRLRDRLAVEGSGSTPPALLCAPVWVDVVVRKKGQVTPLLKVSHDTGLKIIRTEFDDAPPIETRDAAPQYRLQLIVRTLGPESAMRSLNEELKIVDAKGNEFQPTTATRLLEENYRDDPFATPSQNLKRILWVFRFNPQSPPPTKALRFRGTISGGDYWPLNIDLPLRNAQGTMMLTPRSALPFRVVSTTVGKADASAMTDYGTDTIVTVKLQAIGTPATSMDWWRWDNDYSQHVVDAQGKRYWTFPFKRGASPAYPSQSRSYASFLPGTGTPAPAYPDASTPKVTTYSVTYSFKLSQIPASAGALTFHATLSANGSQRVPVSVRLR